MSQSPVLMEVNLPNLTRVSQGKVRDIFSYEDKLLLIASDRVSAFDVVLPDGIPDKGTILTQISAFWFRYFADTVPHHMISADVEEFPDELQAYADQLAGRTMLVQKAQPLAVECIVRGYIAGSGWKDYQRTGRVCDIPLPEGIVESQQFSEPLFTPSTKAELGEHDENISFAAMQEVLDDDALAAKVRDLSLELYNRAAEYLRERGLILCDTKFEFGLQDGELVWIDEAFTPDSSRYWSAANYEPGRPQDSYDKQYLRDYLETLDWNKKDPGPALPEEIIEGIRSRYVEAYETITGQTYVAPEIPAHG